ncbi:glutaredoxin family protein [Priestia aryabhattai]|uniref:glutaredoxin family protein n=1 Tax=Priestia aryabhattai TaxID=412384 RepID=UPI002E1BC1CC|nr:glutaredoxin family protein [Priestia aryabhattai]
MEIKVFSNENCIFCKRQKDWLLENNINFIEKDIAIRENLIEFNSYKAFGTPLTIIKKEDEIYQVVGFNRIKLKKLLSIR